MDARCVGSVASTLLLLFLYAGPQVIDDRVPYSLEAPGVTV